MPSNVPDTIGRYEVLSRLGRGGMGVVYRGRDPRIGGRYVAIKVLHVSDDGLVDRFLQEAATAGRLDHPNIVKVYDFGEHFGDPFIVMEYVEGVTLAELIRARLPLALTRKLAIIRDIAIGLDHAHNVGVVHRDVKPANLMIRKDGSVKILDFGIARVANAGTTQVGTQVGTPNYMSPEQIEAKPVDRRSDVFGLGLVFYELLALQPAFSADATSHVMGQILYQSPEPIDRMCLDLDPAIARIVHTAIEKDPERRYQSLAALADDVDDIRRRLRDAGDEFGGPRPDLPQCEPAPETITAILRQARRDLDAGKFASAVRATSEILFRDPANDEARSLSREALTALDELRAKEDHAKNARRTIEVQEAAFHEGRIQEALDALDQFTPRHSQVTAAAARLRAEAEEIELRRRAEEQRHLAQARWAARELQTARESVETRRFSEAIATLEHIKQVCPDVAEVDAVLGQARAGLAAAAIEAKRRRDVADLVARADHEERANRLEDARRSFQSALQLDPIHPEALGRLARIDASMKRALEESQRLELEDRRRRETSAAESAPSDVEGDRTLASAARTVEPIEATFIRGSLTLPSAETGTVVRGSLTLPPKETATVVRGPLTLPPKETATFVRGPLTLPAEKTARFWNGKVGYVTAAALLVVLAGAGSVWYASSRGVPDPLIQANDRLVSPPRVEPQDTTQKPTGNEPNGKTTTENVQREPAPSPPRTVNPAAEAERVRIAAIQQTLARGELVASADQVTAALREFSRSTALTDLARTVRNDAKSRAADAKQKAERAGRTTVDPFKRGVDRLAAIAAGDDGRESLSKTVAAYLDAASLFDEAARTPATPEPPIVPPGPPAIAPTSTAMPATVATGSGGVLPAPPPPLTPTPIRPPTLGVDEARTVLQTFGELFVTFDAKQLAAIYPSMTKRDQDFLALARKQYRSCTLTFSAPQLATPEGGDVVVLAESVLACKAPSGSPPPDQHLSNSFTLRRVENRWQVMKWNTNIGGGWETLGSLF